MQRPVAIFDLDRTVTRIGSFTPFCLYAAWRLSPLRLVAVPLAVLALAATALKIINRKTLKTMLLALLVGRQPRDRLDKAVDGFIDLFMRRYLRPGATSAIAAERECGAILYLATASYDFYAERFGNRLGFDHAIATRSIWNEGHLVPGIDGENCYGEEKPRRVKERLAADGVSGGESRPHITVYSDDRSDLPSFDWADRAVAVNPRPGLARLAKTHNLEIAAW